MLPFSSFLVSLSSKPKKQRKDTRQGSHPSRTGGMQLLCLLAAALLLGEAGFVIANDHGSYDSSDFYRMVEDVGKGVNYYQLLGVDETVPTSDLRKAFRKASLAWYETSIF